MASPVATVSLLKTEGRVKGEVKEVLFVDLDGTLTASDLLWEALVGAVKTRPLVVFMVFIWLLGGRARLKRGLAGYSAPDVTTLPYREGVLSYIKSRRGEGCAVVLATASDALWADGVARHLGLFDDVIASDGIRNLKGRAKLSAIEAYCEQRGVSRWSYMGDSHADLPIWHRADEVHVVEPSARLLARVRRSGKPLHVLGERRGRLGALVRAIRPHQWAKNGLLFVPLLLAHRLSDFDKVRAATVAFLAFSLFASATYVVNDLLDVEADRAHPRKRERPFAAGILPLPWALPLTLLLLGGGVALSYLFLPTAYLGVLALYLVVSNLYSAVLKSKLIVDVLVLAGLYALRIFAGGVATGLAISEWLLAFSIFLFTSLAFAKRYVEVSRLARQGKTSAKGRDYQVGDLSLLESIGPTSGYLAVLVFALYINSDTLPPFYTHKWLLWLTCPLLLYWVTRLWFYAKRDQLNDDPVVFALTDRVSLGVAATIGLLLVLAGGQP